MRATNLDTIVGLFSFVVCFNGPDTLKSKLSKDGKFNVKDLQAFIDSKVTVPLRNPTVCLHLVPLTCIGFGWRAYLGHIPTMICLSKSGFNIY